MFNITYKDVKMKAAECISTAALAVAITDDPEKVKTLAQTVEVSAKKLAELCDVEIARNKGDKDGMLNMIMEALKNF